MSSNMHISIREGSLEPSQNGSQSNRDQLYRRFKKIHAYEDASNMTHSQKNLAPMHGGMMQTSSQKQLPKRKEIYQMPLKITNASSS